MRGKFIVLEGLDRTGKSTQVGKLLERLEKDGPARLQKFPDRTTQIGKMIDAYLQSKADMDDRAIHLLFSANRWETPIKQDIDKGISVIADRYAFSGIAFSAAKGLPFDFCLGPDRGLPLPDVVIYLTLSPEAASKRGEYGEERYETLDMQRKTREQFGLVRGEMERTHKRIWVEIDADGTVEAIAERIWASIPDVSGSLGTLWT